MQDSFPARAHLVTVLGYTLNRAATSPGVIHSGSWPVSYPCWRSCRRAATVPAVRTTGGAGGGRRCAVYPWEVVLICHRPPNSPSRVVRLAASSPAGPGVVSGIVIPLGWLAAAGGGPVEP